jgi:tryptophan synthase alpha chain
MSQITSVFKPGYKALIAYITVGYPDVGATPEIAAALADSGCDIKTAIPLIFMTYYNPVLNFGLEAFCQSCQKAGINGLIVPDLPPEEGAELEAITRKHDLDLIYLLAPTSTGERIANIAARSRGFIYLVSLTGVTGARDTLPSELESFVVKVRQKAKQPLCVGFGVSNQEQAKRVAAIANGVIVGSRLIQLIEEDATLASLKSFVSSLREALD